MDIQELFDSRYLPGAIVALVGSIVLSGIKSFVGELVKAFVLSLQSRTELNRQAVFVVQIECEEPRDEGEQITIS